MNRLPFTKLAARAIEEGKEIAKYLGFKDISSIFLILGLYGTDGSLASEVLKMHGLTRDMLEEFVQQKATRPQDGRRKASLTPKSEAILEIAGETALKYGCDAIGTEHILMAMVRDGDNEALEVLKKNKIALDGIYTDILVTAGMDYKVAKAEFTEAINSDIYEGEGSGDTILEQYSTDLTEKALEGQLDPVIGRIEELERLMQVLSRRTKNNPCLIGDPGVGKTAIVEGLAQKISSGMVPSLLKNKRILSLDLTRVIAGTKYRGEFEERMKRIVTEVTEDPSIILFIDEIHTMIGAGGSEGAMDASNILKPALARGDFQLIGATTSEEYTKYFEKDAALVRRFQPVRIEEPSIQQTVTILKGLKYRFEDYHRVLVPDEIINFMVTLSDRYISDRFLPDKAIDLLDEACARKRMGLLKNSEDFHEEKNQIEMLVQQTEEAISDGDMVKARKIKEEKLKLQKALDSKIKRINKKQNIIPEINEEDVENIIALWTKIPVNQLKKGDLERLRNLEKELHKQVIGQDQAVKAVAKAIKRSRVGLKDPKRPIGSFLFLGPTGVGKTELSKTLAKAMFGREEDLIRVDMSEYMEKHSVSKIIGSPPGYVGFGEGGQLSEQIRRHPYSVILFDEIEKAHPDVFNILLQVLDDGHITDSNGRQVDFKNTVIIMTSNAGANRIIAPKQLGFAASMDKKKNHEIMTKGVMEEVKQIFRPEFLNRIDETIVFAVLTKEEVREIAKLFISDVKSRLMNSYQISLKVTPGALDWLAEKGYDENYGARPLRRVIQSEIEDVLADWILEGRLKNGSQMTIGKKDKKLTFSVKEASK
ncbi:ATP-dependent Clp protease ATP-binding subunit [Anaerostipes faecalis]|uniref:ATP-dependent Clp protease ATP-binding subunit n=1 Tax=Anaerostipes faecalis TaxID=2738446 RepID=UPI003EFCFE12